MGERKKEELLITGEKVSFFLSFWSDCEGGEGELLIFEEKKDFPLKETQRKNVGKKGDLTLPRGGGKKGRLFLHLSSDGMGENIVRDGRGGEGVTTIFSWVEREKKRIPRGEWRSFVFASSGGYKKKKRKKKESPPPLIKKREKRKSLPLKARGSSLERGEWEGGFLYKIEKNQEKGFLFGGRKRERSPSSFFLKLAEGRGGKRKKRNSIK